MTTIEAKPEENKVNSSSAIKTTKPNETSSNIYNQSSNPYLIQN
jgi:hypothetical protein